MACANGNAAIIERLLTAGADVNATSAAGETALMTAARTGKVDAISVLLRRGANVNARESADGQTALMWAAARNNAGAVKALIEAGAQVDLTATGNKANPPAPIGLNKGSNPLDYGFLKFKAIDVPTFTALDYAVRQGNIEAVKALLDGGANVNRVLEDGSSPLLRAIINNHYELAAVLIERGADVKANKTGWTPLHQLSVMRRPNTNGNGTPWATPTGNLDSLDLLKLLVARGADVNARMTSDLHTGSRTQLSRLGATPFLLSAKSCDVPAMRLLVAAGADPNIKTDNDDTPMMLAAGLKIWGPGEDPGTDDECLEAVKLTFELGNDVQAVNSNYDTALHGAALRGTVSTVNFLVEHGAKWKKEEATNDDGWTPYGVANGVFYSNHVHSAPAVVARMEEIMKSHGVTDFESYKVDLSTYDCGVYCSTRTPAAMKLLRAKRAARDAENAAKRKAAAAAAQKQQ
jgi:uncharacterized protein